MKKLIITALALSSFTLAQASLLLSGTAISDLTAGDVNRVGAFVVSMDGSAFPTSLGADLSLSDSATYGASFAFINLNSVVDFFGVGLPSGGTVNYGLGVDQGDSFGVILFNSSTTTTVGGDTYQIYTDDSWVLPADPAGALSFGSAFDTVSASGQGPSSSGTVVPEPSSFALLAGCFGLAWVMVRRRA